MKHRYLVTTLVAGALGVTASFVGIAQSAPAPAAAPAAKGAAPAAPAAKAAAAAQQPLVILDFKPTLSDLMTMMIQPRHIKLWAAAQQKNWTLAAFELNEMRSAFDKIAATIPKYPQPGTQVDLGPTFQSLMGPKIQQVNGALAAQNPTQFATAFNDLTTQCNGCHEALNHPYLVIKVPAAESYPNQDFRPVPGAAPLPGQPPAKK
jgi:hypothetical protein